MFCQKSCPSIKKVVPQWIWEHKTRNQDHMRHQAAWKLFTPVLRENQDVLGRSSRQRGKCTKEDPDRRKYLQQDRNRRTEAAEKVKNRRQ